MRALFSGLAMGVLLFELIAGGFLIWLYFQGFVVYFKNPIDLASLSLTAATIVLAVATLLLAILALWGFKEIISRAEAAAAREAKEYLNQPEFQVLVFRKAEEYLSYEKEAGTETDVEADALAQALMEANGGNTDDR